MRFSCCIADSFLVILANFLRSTSGSALKDVKIQLDCSSLLTSMVEQARILVLKAVAAATKTNVPTSSNPGSHPNNKVQQSHTRPNDNQVIPPTSPLSASKSLACFRSAINIAPTSAGPSPRLSKARCSALRLNNILQGNGDEASDKNKPTLGMRKIRSVRWNTPGEIPNLKRDTEDQAPKKARSVHVAKLKSFKSFGRPHAGDFGSGPRNATFGEFGGRSTGMWGRDGRMAAHPTPMKDATLRDPLSGEFQGADKNATFNLQQAAAATTRNRPSIHLASGDGNTTNIPRTATVLESLLLKRSMT